MIQWLIILLNEKHRVVWSQHGLLLQIHRATVLEYPSNCRFHKDGSMTILRTPNPQHHLSIRHRYVLMYLLKKLFGRKWKYFCDLFILFIFWFWIFKCYHTVHLLIVFIALPILQIFKTVYIIVYFIYNISMIA